MIVSHEVPLCLLEESKNFNDYDYCLPHLLDKYSSYREYFLWAKEKGRFIIMDNGLFEGIKHTEQDLIEKINLIEPDIFIVPDEWNDFSITLRNAKYWMNTIKHKLPLKTKLMVVMQGSLYSQFTELYTACEDLGYTHFSFNHASSYYQTHHKNPNKLINQMLGRHDLINSLKYTGYIKDNHYIHLLGCSLPQEFLFYKNPYYSFIKSVDTSNPIICGAKHIVYTGHGLFEKPSEKLEEFIENDELFNNELIKHNIKLFRTYIYNK